MSVTWGSMPKNLQPTSALLAVMMLAVVVIVWIYDKATGKEF